MTLTHDCKGYLTSFSAFQLDNDNEFPFSPAEYSRFKHGAINFAEKFGKQLAEKFIQEKLKHEYDGKQQIVVIPSAYSYIPTASFYIQKYFTDELNNYLFLHNYPVVQTAKIYRTVTYREDYGEMSAEDRYSLIKNDKFYLDKDYLDGKLLIFIDDIKITGTHERIIINMLNEYNICNNGYMLYFAELKNKNIPPNIENKLNNYAVKSISDIESIIENETFRFNSRVVKYILNREDLIFDKFVKKQTKSFLEELYFCAIGNEFYKFKVYLRNINELKNILNKH